MTVRPSAAIARTLLVLLAIVVVLTGASVIAGLVVVDTAWGREKIAEKIEANVSEKIPGSLTVGEIQHLELSWPPGNVKADIRDVIFADPEGRVVIGVDFAVIDANLTQVRDGVVRFRRADLTGSTLTLHAAKDGRTSLENTFSPPKDERTESDDPRSIMLDLEGIHFEDLTFKVIAKTNVVMKNLTGVVDVHLGRTGGVEVDFESDGTVVQPKFFGDSIRIGKATGTIRGGEREVLDVDLTARFGEKGRLDGNVKYLNPAKRPVVIHIDVEGSALDHLKIFAANVKTHLGDQVELHTD